LKKQKVPKKLIRKWRIGRDYVEEGSR
jgi:hypothetical protein